jgi:sulfide:quinone oxidoreductase
MRRGPARRSVAEVEDHGPNRVLIAGGGVAGLEAMLALRHLAEERLRIELLSPQRDFVYRPLAVAEPFGHGRPHRFDLARLIAERGASYVPDALVAVDTDRRLAVTRGGGEIAYDSLVIACGAVSKEALPGALTFWGTPGSAEFRALVRELESGAVRDVVFVLPPGAGWPLPLYELALLTRRHLGSRRVTGVGVTIATHEAAPLELFGAAASETVARLLAERGIAVCTGCYPARVGDGALEVVPGDRLPADRVVTMPRLVGRRIAGVPEGGEGFIPVDEHGRVAGLDDVYAAGDATSFPVKQGGIAAQQADAVAEWLAASAGAPVDPKPFRPVLRGLLLTGREPASLRAEISGGGGGETSEATSEALWWPPGKIAGKYLAPHLAAVARAELQPPPPVDVESVSVEVEVSPGHGISQRDSAAAAAR